MRQELNQEEGKTKNDSQAKKMQELDGKIKNLEKQKKEKEELEREQAEQERQKQQQRQLGNRGFLDNIKSYSVEDI